MNIMIENVSYSVRYCKISFLINPGSSSLSNSEPFLLIRYVQENTLDLNLAVMFWDFFKRILIEFAWTHEVIFIIGAKTKRLATGHAERPSAEFTSEGFLMLLPKLSL